jgi:hypothetical protein
VGHRHDEIVPDLRADRRRIHENTPKKSGFATGGVMEALRWPFAAQRVVVSGLATLLAGTLATVVAG